MTLSNSMDRIIRWGFYLLFILVPLILTPWNYELFEYNKMMVTYGLTAIIVGAWVVKMAARKEIAIAKTPLDIPIALFVVSQLASTFLSIDPHVSWFGYYSRFNGGMMSIISYVLLFYAFVSNFMETERQSDNKTVRKNQNTPVLSSQRLAVLPLLKVILVTGVIVAIYGVLERLGIDKHLWVQDVQNRVFSTLGQPNWLAAFLVALIPISIVFALRNAPDPDKPEDAPLSQIVAHTGWAATTVLLFVTLLFTRSRSGMLGLALADVALFSFLFAQKRKHPALVPTAAILHAAFALIVFFNGTHIAQLDPWITLRGWKDRLTKQATVEEPVKPSGGTMLEAGGTESGTIRKYVWQGAFNAWNSSPKTQLVGTGTETFAFAFYQYRPVEHNMTSEWDFLYNKAHNEYLNYLTTTGVLGLGSYLLFILTFIGWFIMQVKNSKLKVQNEKPENFALSTLNFALFSGWLSILVTNFFGFSVVIMQLFLFLFPAIVIAGAVSKKRTLSLPSGVSSVLPWVAGITVIIIIGGLVRAWSADKAFASGYRLARAGQYAQAYTAINKALALQTTEPLYSDEASGTLAALALAFSKQNDGTSAAELTGRAIAASNQAISVSPHNVNFWKTRTKVYYTLSEIDPTWNKQAIEALEKGIALSPNDPKLYYNLAILQGRQDADEKAVELLIQAKKLKPNYRDAYFALSIFYDELGKPEQAKATLQEYLDTVDPNDKDFLKRIGGE